MAVPVIDVSAGKLDLSWSQGDPVSIEFTVPDMAGEWGTTLQAQVRGGNSSSSTLLGSFTVAAVVAGADVEITLTMTSAESSGVPTGRYWWDMQEVAGVTRLGGRVHVKGSVTT